MWITVAPVGAAAATAAVMAVAWARGVRRAREQLDAARAEAKLTVKSGALEAAAQRRAAETEAREQSLERRAAAERELGRDHDRLARRSERLAAREASLSAARRDVDERRRVLDERQRLVRAAEDE